MEIIRHDEISASVPQNKGLIFVLWQYCSTSGRRTIFYVWENVAIMLFGEDNDILENNEVEILWDFLHKNIAS